VHEVSWLELDGAANARDLAGLPTADGRSVQPGRLIRSDNLQDLSDRDVRTLVDALRVRTVADLRTGVEVDLEGPGPLTEVDDVEIRHLSLFPESGTTTDAAAADDDGDDGNKPVVLPWQNRDEAERDGRQGVSGVYLGYLDERADSVVEALRLIAYSPGATIVHCAAGKDRTGTIVALALSEVGVTRDAVVADYARTAERIYGIFARLRASSTYREDLETKHPDAHAPKPATMERLLDAMDAEFGGVAAWLRAHGWTEHDAATLRAKLLAP
jgi:protein tyrosine/serine phosphatase